MKKLRLFELIKGEKELIEEVKMKSDSKELEHYLENFITKKYPVTSYISFEIVKVKHDDHLIIFEVNYSFKNSSYFSRKLLCETHTILLKEVDSKEI